MRRTRQFTTGAAGLVALGVLTAVLVHRADGHSAKDATPPPLGPRPATCSGSWSCSTATRSATLAASNSPAAAASRSASSPATSSNPYPARTRPNWPWSPMTPLRLAPGQSRGRDHGIRRPHQGPQDLAHAESQLRRPGPPSGPGSRLATGLGQGLTALRHPRGTRHAHAAPACRRTPRPARGSHRHGPGLGRPPEWNSIRPSGEGQANNPNKPKPSRRSNERKEPRWPSSPRASAPARRIARRATPA